ncbi:mannose-1-phosphate guanylyltransferase/mannose-6-phosphate isomerase [Paracoccus denitrificans]|jgi:mannose-1-phosphate guanylyltransferase/mannose-1-phosphate guanylyltransferase/mannose-6-phosphate isomerase|uniref:mannose-1-phosphate guanylyltransferase n=1 Tax=Paracoccus denitrificans (strain Pd 1222) TaxID=318586 RepID=A1B9B0_PARDP|nr:mannose-1-phosphate guanylyltransferase/mannose-6-phosphate isomerase [Paracoccus denitrificans]ABL72104.1 mannose-6-phosphate isomerase, type 2 / mannose-1-phosphate guanylyltransferase (GDP) [Paracoccus denitrificans PD1222]MBB4625985.1 mannose-1-phosphate guanylyltransferase/mannose-1-phosphate guanylyltransferase/mannose-6-phosphate isomerase [Paracoccus denitrificans]MCU7426855.1 mannose-1-phosphate guanylyltransferase/mannose-6-phosphate isomerase [Paracoccus denitrificans]QAR28681.1 m
MTITPVLLAGGSGTRLWPVSRKSFPKQFAPLVGDDSLFQASARRLSGPRYGAPLVMTNADFRFIVAEQLDQIGIAPAAILIEPSGRNTAPAILAAALRAAETDPDAVLLVAPSDHVVPDTEAFGRAVDLGLPAARAGRIVTFGITPTRPETGYGYMEAEGGNGGEGPLVLKRFVEKPDAENAARMIAQGDFLWNAGIFLFAARTMVEAFETHAPEYLGPVQAALTEARMDLGFLRLAPEPWDGLPDRSVDYAVLEKAGNLSVVRYSGHWSDLGGWDAVWHEIQRDEPAERGAVVDGRSTAIDCDNVLLRAQDEGIEVVGIGLRDVMVVATDDAVLVAGMDRAQEVRKAVSALKAKGARQAEHFLRDHRPWGWFETLALADRFQVKRIVVNPGAALSLQSHFHRSEHWIVVSGTARVTVDETVTLLTENQSIYVPLGAVHRLENPGKVPMVLIEVQTGVYLGEDDIVRYEDVYSRG